MEELFEVKDIDKSVYENEIERFLPDEFVDIHTHVWKAELKTATAQSYSRVVTWPARVAKDNPVEDLVRTYELMFPGKRVTPLIFSSIKPGDDMDGLNGYIREAAAQEGFPSLLYSHPTWQPAELERRLNAGGHVGIKSYLDLSPSYLPRQEIRIFDFFPPRQLEVLDGRGGIVMLHIPRDGRLGDPVNLAQMKEIDERYPNASVIIAHVGRAYCEEDVGDAFDVISETKNLLFDFSANTNQTVFEELIKAVGPSRVMFGSDLPILRMRMKRVCRDGHYVNIVPKGLYGDLSGDKNMGEVSGEEADSLTFFMYEELRAFCRAAAACGLGPEEREQIFNGNARRILKKAGYA